VELGVVYAGGAIIDRQVYHINFYFLLFISTLYKTFIILSQRLKESFK